jgi:hypothetical protein
MIADALMAQPEVDHTRTLTREELVRVLLSAPIVMPQFE